MHDKAKSGLTEGRKQGGAGRCPCRERTRGLRSSIRHPFQSTQDYSATAYLLSPLATMVSLPIFELIVFSVTLAVVLSVSVPLSGTLVRYRASYNPRGLALDAEGGATPHTGPVVNSYFGMMKRVYNIEVCTLPQRAGFAPITTITDHTGCVRAGPVCTRASVRIYSELSMFSLLLTLCLLVPTLLTASAIAIFVLLFLGSSSMGSTHKYNAPSAGIVGRLSLIR